MPKLMQGADRFRTNARIAKASPFEAVETIEDRPRNVSCDITSEGRKYLASKGILNNQIINYAGKPVDLLKLLLEKGCKKEEHYTFSVGSPVVY